MEGYFKLGASAAAAELCEWVQIGIDVDIPHCKYYVKPYLSPRFSDACAATIAQKNHLFHLYQKNKSSASKCKFRQASNRWKRVLEAAKLAYANTTKESITSQKLHSHNVCQIANSDLNKDKSSIHQLWQLYLVICLRLLTGCSMLVFFANSNFIGFQFKYLALFHSFSVIDNFKWFLMGSLSNPMNAGVSQGSILGATLFVSFPMMLSVILLSMLMILLSILGVITHLICDIS